MAKLISMLKFNILNKNSIILKKKLWQNLYLCLTSKGTSTYSKQTLTSAQSEQSRQTCHLQCMLFHFDLNP